ncbi:hypothetical protein ENHYD8BJ_280001 [Enhydrobacter sp. 8BJ]|nr:hypothetical protein ENHYD8BJ_280001 [Enhydrobacter sp. 8BJ]
MSRSGRPGGRDPTVPVHEAIARSGARATGACGDRDGAAHPTG